MNINRIDGESSGVFVIAPTPFDDNGELDLDSARHMCEFYLEHGATGMTILGMMGEAPKLTQEESISFAEVVLSTLAGRIPVVVGVSSPALNLLSALSEQVMSLGAAGVMVAPMPTLKTDTAISAYYAAVIEQLGEIPVCLQDYPQTLGVHFSVELLVKLFAEHASLCMLKHEDHPGLNKLGRFRAACSVPVSEGGIGRRISILVGNGGLFLPEEMARGADGAMTGFAFPEMLRQVTDLMIKGDTERANAVFNAYLPLVRYELQPGLGLAIRKYVLARRGAIKTAKLRAPGPALTQADIAEVEALWARQQRSLQALDIPSR
ncbi:MAG: dihydrodipicolinate synthase family protein [Burkholderiaceae bacterium]